MACQNLGEVYLSMNKPDSALMYEQKDFEICKRIGFYDDFGYTLLTLGVFMENGKHCTCSKLLWYGYRRWFEKKLRKTIKLGIYCKGRIFASIFQRDSSIFYAKRALSVIANTGFTNYKLNAAKLLLDNYRTSNVDSAFKYSEIYRIENDSVFSAKAIQQTQLMTFENEKKQQELIKEKKIAEQHRKQNIQYAIIALGILTFIILF